MIIIANILVIITLFTFISYPLVFGILLWNVIAYDGATKSLDKGQIRRYQLYALIIPFGLGLLTYYQQTKQLDVTEPKDSLIHFRKSIWIKNFKALLYTYPILIFLSTVLMIYFKYL